jgi:hypothetical protein
MSMYTTCAYIPGANNIQFNVVGVAFNNSHNCIQIAVVPIHFIQQTNHQTQQQINMANTNTMIMIKQAKCDTTCICVRMNMCICMC